MNLKRSLHGWFIALGLLLVTGGCERVSNEEMARRVLEADPSFHNTLERKRDIDRQAQALRADLETRRHAIELQKQTLEAAYQRERELTEQRVTALYSRGEQERKAIALERSSLDHDATAQRATVRSLKATLGDLKRSLTNDLPETDRKQQEARLADVETKLDAAIRQLQTLEERLEMTSFKERLLRPAKSRPRPPDPSQP